MMQRRGLAPRLLESEDGSGAAPGLWRVAGARGATRTLVLYAHYDGQPVTPAAWTVTAALHTASRRRADLRPQRVGRQSRGDGDPRRGRRLRAGAARARASTSRSCSRARRKRARRTSPHCSAATARLLRSDGWVIIDGPAHQSGPPQLTLGVRGIAGAELIVYGAVRPLHSGHYGNWAPNPAMMLAAIAGVDEGRRRPGDDRRLLRRRDAAFGGGAGADRRGAGARCAG